MMRLMELCMLWCTCMMMGAALYVATHWILVSIMFTVLLMLLCIMITYPCPLVVLRIVCKLTHNRHVVQVMKDDGEIIYGLARGEWGKVLTMQHGFILGRKVKLYPCGLAQDSYFRDLWFWRPCNLDLCVQMQLMYDVVDWDSAREVTWVERYELYCIRVLKIANI
jgi:hypothetical protein